MNDTENIYAPPQTETEFSQQNHHVELASRGSRLGSAFIDGIIMMVIIAPIQFLAGVYDGIAKGEVNTSPLEQIGYGILGIVVFILLNGKFLVSSGQTIGKKAVGIKIVDMNGNLPTIRGHLMKRYGIYFLVGNIPVIGSVLSVINILFIFRADKRCIHDLVGGTQVVRK